MGQRLELHDILKELLGSDHVYFQPPPSVQMEYPCIVYRRDYEVKRFADDMPYSRVKRYQVTVIDRNPDSEVPDKVSQLPRSSFERSYTADNLNHDVFRLFF